MPLKLADLASKTKSTTLEYDGETVNLEIRHHLVTPKLLADLSALDDLSDKAPEKLRAISEQVARLVASWDVIDADGSMFPLDVERLTSELPVLFQCRVLNAASGVMTVGEAQAPAQA